MSLDGSYVCMGRCSTGDCARGLAELCEPLMCRLLEGLVPCLRPRTNGRSDKALLPLEANGLPYKNEKCILSSVAV